MKLGDIIPEGAVFPNLQSDDNDEILKEMIDSLAKNRIIASGQSEYVLRAILDREDMGSTSIGRGVAVPHAKCDMKLFCAVGFSKKGVDFYSMDGDPVHILFMLLFSGKSIHLEALALISRMTREMDMVESIRKKGFDQALIEIKDYTSLL